MTNIENTPFFQEIASRLSECHTQVVRRPPLKQIAELAGVSEPTVSRVLNGRTGVAPTTRDKVVAALHSIGFDRVPEPQAVRSSVVGIVCGDFLNPVFSTFVHHISNDLARSGYLTTVAVTDRNLNPEERCVDELVRNNVDGIVFIGGRHAELGADRRHYERLVDAAIPIVFVNGSPTELDVPHVWCDEQVGARKAVEHLIRLGHSRIGCLLGPRSYTPTERFITGYRQVLAEHDLDEPDGAITDAPFTLAGGRAAANRLLDIGITALLAGNDLMALGAVVAAEQRPEGPQLSVVGYDGTDFTTLSNPPLTTLRQPFEDMSKLIAEAVLSEIDGPKRYRDRFVFEPQLIVRESTGRVPSLQR